MDILLQFCGSCFPDWNVSKYLGMLFGRPKVVNLYNNQLHLKLNGTFLMV